MRGLSFVVALAVAVTGAQAAQGCAPDDTTAARAPYLLPKLDLEAIPLELPAWRRAERPWLWSYVALGAVDAYQTTRRPSDSREINPLLGDHPSRVEVVLFKSVATWGTLRLAHRVRDEKRRATILRLLNVVQFSIVLHNERVTGGIVGR